MPERGVNAVYRAARAVAKLERFTFPGAPHPVLGACTLNVGTFRGGLNINSVPDAATFEIDIRTIPEQKHGPLREHLAGYLGEEVVLEPITDLEGLWSDPGDAWIRLVYELATPLAGERPVPRAAPYFTDGAALKPAFADAPTVVIGPGELALAHQTDEYCLVERIEQAVGLYEELARRWCRI
jgi:succinyl-diaminopimelate desuccinylase